ncbi:MAG: C40 family peptidase [Bacteroidales bacterium]|nr:C40 family peptidase [Bacteroidales bacterium]
MRYGMCLLPVVPMRTRPAETEEQCSQLIFGDVFSIIDSNDSRVLIETFCDSYRGWVDKKQYVEISKDDFYFLTKSKPLYTSEWVNEIKITNIEDNITYIARVPFGCCLFSNKYRVGNYLIEAPKVKLIKSETFSEEKLLKYIEMYNYAPYLWGGKSNFATDCSGFTQSLFKLFGCALRRDASLQAEQGVIVEKIEHAKAGDLAFFSNKEGKIVHVGVVLPNGYIAHASGFVRVDRLDSKGILRENDNIYTHFLCKISRFFN